MNSPIHKTFIMKEIFDFQTGSLMDNSIFSNGLIPRITATDMNNGVAFFTNDPDNKNFRVFENFISISFLGSVFYHKGKASLDMKIHGIKPKNYSLNSDLAMYLIPLIKNFSSKYEYGYQLSMRLLPEQRITLPIDHYGNPDWLLMENSVKNIKKHHYIRAKKFLVDELKKIENFEDVSIENTNWEEFKIKNVFTTFQRGKRLIRTKQIEGTTPYISSTALNNGIDGFIDNELSADNRLFSKGITVANSGSVGKAFFHGYSFVGSDHITMLWNKQLNEYSAQFVTTCLEQIGGKYSFNREMNNHRLSNDIIHLPVTTDGDIDYFFMENYIKKIRSEKIKKVIKFLD